MLSIFEPPPCGPGCLDRPWRTELDLLRKFTTGAICLNRGWDLDWERQQWTRSAARGRPHLSVRLSGDEILIGPLWAPRAGAGCAGCAETRGRTILGHPLTGNPARACTGPVPDSPFLLELLKAALAHLVSLPLQPGELYAVSSRGTRRHRVAPSVYCPICGPSAAGRPATRRPGPLVLHRRSASDHDPTRGRHGDQLMKPGRLRDRLVDARYGPVQAILRESRSPFAMSMAVMPDAPAMGHGRAVTFAETEPVAVLEAYERLGGFPYESPILTDLAYRDVSGYAVDPARLGQYTKEQLEHATCRVRPATEATPMDWAWGHDLADGRPLLVPADVAFYQYEYTHRGDRRAARALDPRQRRNFFWECSSGCAVGASLEEAALHSLFELAERDAFLMSWHRAVPLPAIAEASITHPVNRAMIDLIKARGFDVHVLAATQDIELPVVWVLAVNRMRPFPATFSSAGSGADPESAIRGALTEVAQLVTNPIDWDRPDVEPMVADPWLVQELPDHVRLYSMPEMLPRATACLGGPRVTLGEAFPGWPDRLRRAAGGDVLGALEYVRGLFAGAGLNQVVLVDQTTREHADAGIAAARAVVPDSVPMCFGHAQQRLANLPRLAAALRGTAQAGRQIPYDPHPFP